MSPYLQLQRVLHFVFDFNARVAPNRVDIYKLQCYKIQSGEIILKHYYVYPRMGHVLRLWLAHAEIETLNEYDLVWKCRSIRQMYFSISTRDNFYLFSANRLFCILFPCVSKGVGFFDVVIAECWTTVIPVSTAFAWPLIEEKRSKFLSSDKCNYSDSRLW